MQSNESTHVIHVINHSFELFQKTFNEEINRDVPLRPATRKEKRLFQKPCLTADLLQSIKHK